MFGLKKNKFEFNIHPGKIIEQHLRILDISKKQLSDYTGISRVEINAIICGKEDISQEIAEKLEPVLKMPATYWMNLQHNYYDSMSS